MMNSEDAFKMDYVILPITGVLITLLAGFFLPNTAHLIILILPLVLLALIYSWFNPYMFILLLLAIIPLDSLVALPEAIRTLSLFKLLFPIPLAILCLGLVIRRFSFLQLNFLDVAIIGWTLLNLFLVPLSVDTDAALDFCRRFVSMSLFYFLVTRFMYLPKRTMQVINVVFYSTVISVVIGTFSYLTGSNPFSIYVDPTLVRATGGSGLDPNSYAASLFLPLWLAMAFVVDKSGKKGKYVFLAFFGLLLTGILLTYSRSAFLCLSLMFLIALFIWKKHLTPVHFIIFLLVFICILPLLPSDYMERIITLKQLFSSDRSDTSLIRRANYITVGWNIIKEYPIFGAGPGNFAVLHAKAAFQPNMALIGIERLPHNLFLQVASETGLFGIFFFTMTIFCACRSLIPSMKSGNPTSPFSAATFISLSGLLFMGLFLHMLQAKTFWLVLIFARLLPGMGSWKH